MNKIDYFVFTLIFGTLSAPSISAQSEALGTIIGSIRSVASIVDKLLPILLMLTIIFFFYRLTLFIFSPSKDESIKEGLISSVLIMFVVFSIYGIIALLQAATGTTNSNCTTGDSKYGKILFKESSFMQNCG